MVNGGPAFPQPDIYHQNGQIEYGSQGMTLRDYFAAQAVPSFLIGQSFQAAARDAYTLADAMLEARGTTAQGESQS